MTDDELRALFEEFLVARRNAARANDPKTQRTHETAAFELGRELAAGMLTTPQARRNAAAAVGREPDEVQAWDPEAVVAGQQEITLATLMTPEGATMAKHILGRVFLDHPYLLPPGLPLHAATALYLTILREPDTWLNRWPRGTAETKNVVIARAEATSVYYHAGYYGLSLPDAAEQLFKHDLHRWEALDRSRKRHGFTPDCYAAKALGEADVKALRRYVLPYTIHYTLGQLELLRQHGADKARQTRS